MAAKHKQTDLTLSDKVKAVNKKCCMQYSIHYSARINSCVFI